MRRVLVLEDDDDLRAVMCDLVQIACHAECVAVASFGALIERRDEVLGCDTALLDVNLGPNEPSGIDAYKFLRECGFRGAMYFLTGHARTHPLVEQARDLAGVRVLEKPVGVDVLQQLAGTP